MRLIAKTAIVGVAAAVGVGIAAPAEAATHKWTAKKSIPYVTASGTWTKTAAKKAANKQTKVKVKLVNSKADGYSGCVQLRFVKKAGVKQTPKALCQVNARTYTLVSGPHTATTTVTSKKGYTKHLYVREGKASISNGHHTWGAWKKIF